MAAVAAGDGSFRWEDLDERLVSPKLNELTEEMHRRAAEAEHQIASETAKNGNSARYVPQFLRFHEQLADEWAARAYVVYCDAWNEQRRAVSPSFIRAVRDNAIIPLIAARNTAVKAEISLRANRRRKSPPSVALAEWSRSVDRLTKRWTSKLEAEAVAAEYAASEERNAQKMGAFQGSAFERQMEAGRKALENFRDALASPPEPQPKRIIVGRAMRS